MRPSACTRTLVFRSSSTKRKGRIPERKRRKKKETRKKEENLLWGKQGLYRRLQQPDRRCEKKENSVRTWDACVLASQQSQCECGDKERAGDNGEKGIQKSAYKRGVEKDATSESNRKGTRQKGSEKGIEEGISNLLKKNQWKLLLVKKKWGRGKY